MRSVPDRGPWVAVWLLSAKALLAGYGETVTVEIKPGNIISYGWVVIRESHSGPDIYTPHFPTKTYFTLVNLNGAPVGDIVEVLGYSPIWPGWVKTATRGADNMLEQRTYNIRYRIEKQYAADNNTGNEEIPPVTLGPVELDVRSLDWAGTLQYDNVYDRNRVSKPWHVPYFPDKPKPEPRPAGGSYRPGP